MAADMYIHVIPEQPVTGTTVIYKKSGGFRYKKYTGMVDEKTLAAFFSSTIGSKWYNAGMYSGEEKRRAFALVSGTPSIHVGEVSWLKAALLNNEKEFVPAPVQKIADIIDERLPVIDDELIEQIKYALDLENKTDYMINDKNEIISFLERYKGLRCFTVSW